MTLHILGWVLNLARLLPNSRITAYQEGIKYVDPKPLTIGAA
jgi:hypothetical protein